jgi:phage terminase large subunit GpA-like protein
MVWGAGVSFIKGEFYQLLNTPPPTDEELIQNNGLYPVGWSHFPEYSEEYFKQLTAESLVKKVSKGRTVFEWQQNGRNEALDCHVYNRATASILGIDAFGERHWKKFEEALPTISASQSQKQKKAESIRRPTLREQMGL